MGGVAAFGGARRRCPALGTPVLPPSTLIVNLSQLWLGRGGHFTPGMVAIKHSARRVLLRRMPAHTTPPIPAATGRNGAGEIGKQTASVLSRDRHLGDRGVLPDIRRRRNAAAGASSLNEREMPHLIVGAKS